MRVQASPDGAYDEAMEASAERLMLAWNDHGSRAYSSDAETSDDQETESCSFVGAASSLSSSLSASSDDESEDIDGEISFLREKQGLLKRAIAAMKEEETYDASRARLTANGALPYGSSIWVEAKEVLDVLNRRDDGKREKETPKETLPDPSPVSKPRNPKRPKIDVSSVLCLSSSEMGFAMPSVTSCSVMRDVCSMPFQCTGPWMAKALVHSLPSLKHPHQDSTSSSSTWEIVNDPTMGPLVVPPSKIPSLSRMQLKDAIAFTPVAQLIALSTPPFCIVHANKAFSMFSGMESVIGKPVESILQVVQDIIAETASRGALDTEDAFLESELQGSNQACKLRVIPIMDQSRHPQQGMSHLLIRIQASAHQSTAIDESSIQKLSPKKLALQRNPHRIVGSVS